VNRWHDRSPTTFANASSRSCRCRSTNHRHRLPARAWLVGGNAQKTKGRHGLGFALQLQGGYRLDLDRVLDQPQRLGAEQYLAGLSRLFQAGGDVDRVAGRQPLLCPRHDFARIDARPQLETSAVRLGELGVEAAEGVAKLGRGPNRT